MPDTSSPPLVAGYFRVSQARDGMKAPEMYRDDVERYCSYRKLTLGETFSDIDYSAYRGSKERPALEELKRRRHEFSSVIIPKLSRFGRSVKDLVELFDMFDRDGIALVFLDMNIDTATSQGRLLRHIMAAFAEYESDVRGDYSRASHRMLIQEGRPMGAWPLFGYTIVGKKVERRYEVEPQAARVVREVFSRYVAGGSIGSLVHEFNRERVPTARGASWTHSQIQQMLSNTGYAAFRVFEGKEYPCAWKPIVTRELWDEAAARRCRMSIIRAPGAPNSSTYLLSSLLVCGICAKNLIHGIHTHRIAIYRCTTGFFNPPYCLGGQITARRAEELVRDAVVEAAEVRCSGGGAEFQRSWAEADLPRQRLFLREAIERVVLVPRPPGDRTGKVSGVKRTIRIEWARRWSLEVFTYLGATSTLTPADTSINSPKGKTWREWRKAKLLPR